MSWILAIPWIFQDKFGRFLCRAVQSCAELIFWASWGKVTSQHIVVDIQSMHWKHGCMHLLSWVLKWDTWRFLVKHGDSQDPHGEVGCLFIMSGHSKTASSGRGVGILQCWGFLMKRESGALAIGNCRIVYSQQEKYVKFNVPEKTCQIQQYFTVVWFFSVKSCRNPISYLSHTELLCTGLGRPSLKQIMTLRHHVEMFWDETHFMPDSGCRLDIGWCWMIWVLTTSVSERSFIRNPKCQSFATGCVPKPGWCGFQCRAAICATQILRFSKNNLGATADCQGS